MVLVSIISSGALAPCTNSVTTALEISGLGNDSTTVPTRFASWASDDTHSSARWATACRRSGFVSKPTRGILPDSAVAMAEPALPRPTIPTVVCIVESSPQSMWWLIVCRRQGDSEGGPLTGRTDDRERAPVQFHQGAGNSQPQASARGLPDERMLGPEELGKE